MQIQSEISTNVWQLWRTMAFTFDNAGLGLLSLGVQWQLNDMDAS